jgi:hypothetical protein
VFPIVAVQIAPALPAPALEQQLLAACNAGLEHGRCVPARAVADEKPHGIALVSWDGAARVSIEVGLANGDRPVWFARELHFTGSDPEVERWRAVGLTIASLSDDPRYWPAPPEAGPSSAAGPRTGASPIDTAPVTAVEPVPSALAANAATLELAGLGGTGVVSGPLRWGAELRFALPIASPFFATGSASYAQASDAAFDVRWFDVRLGLGLALATALDDLGLRVRLELLGENVAVTARRLGASAQASAWVPGASLGADLIWALDERWLLFSRADAFWLDGATAVVSAGERAGASAGAGVLLGLGAGRAFW